MTTNSITWGLPDMETETETAATRLERLVPRATVTAARAESLAIAHAQGVDDATFRRLAAATRLARAVTVILPAVSRGRGWARLGRGPTAAWGERTATGYRVTTGRWTVGADDGGARKHQAEWTVAHVLVSAETWTIAS